MRKLINLEKLSCSVVYPEFCPLISSEITGRIVVSSMTFEYISGGSSCDPWIVNSNKISRRSISSLLPTNVVVSSFSVLSTFSHVPPVIQLVKCSSD